MASAIYTNFNICQWGEKISLNSNLKQANIFVKIYIIFKTKTLVDLYRSAIFRAKSLVMRQGMQPSPSGQLGHAMVMLSLLL